MQITAQELRRLYEALAWLNSKPWEPTEEDFERAAKWLNEPPPSETGEQALNHLRDFAPDATRKLEELAYTDGQFPSGRCVDFDEILPLLLEMIAEVSRIPKPQPSERHSRPLGKG